MRPSSVSRAAPTRKWENGASACSRAARAASSSGVMALSLQQHAGDGGVEQRCGETNKQGPAAEAGQVVAAFRCEGADAAELNADRGEVGETGEGECRQLVRARAHVVGDRLPALELQVGVVLVDRQLGA